MSLHAILFSLGLFLAGLPYLGFPHSWDDVFAVLLGVIIMALAFLVRAEKIKLKSFAGERIVGGNIFKESKPSDKKFVSKTKTEGRRVEVRNGSEH